MIPESFSSVPNTKPKRGCNTMGFFSKILEKLGLGGKDQAAPAAAAPAKPAMAKPAAAMGAVTKPTAVDKTKDDVASPAPAAVAPKAVAEVDVVKKLEQLGKGSGLDWKVSIVDLLKLLDIDSSREARNELAKELGCPAELMSDSAKMNTWLHKTVLRKIAENGGNIPQELLK
jgi:hypothetical protein